MTVQKIIYFGFNDFKKYKRGVENVILTQRHSVQSLGVNAVYIYFGQQRKVHKYQDIVCIEIPKSFWCIRINVIVKKLKKKFEKQNQAHLIHSHNYLLSCFSFYTTDIFTVHDGLYYQKNSEGLGINFIWKLIEKTVYARSRKLHFISDFSFKKSLATHNAYKKKGGKIYNTTPLEILSNHHVNIAPEINKYEVLIVRNIERRANLGLIAEVAKRLSKTNPQLEITVIGKGPLLEYYTELIKNDNIENMKMKGYVSDYELVRYYNACNLVVVPCLDGEGFGLPVIEGYLFNKPVLASNVCALPEVIMDHKFLFNNNADALHELIIAMMEYNIKDDFKNYYLKKFSSSVIEKQYRELYASV